jgi:hypothetical protein
MTAERVQDWTVMLVVRSLTLWNSRRARSVEVRNVGTAGALDHKSGATRVIVWLGFLNVVIWSIVGLTWLFSPGPVPAQTWAASVPGVLEINGLPQVRAQRIDAQTASISVVTKPASKTYRVTTRDMADVRVFWRGQTLVVDAGDGPVWRIDWKHDLLLQAPDSYGWQR